MPFGVCWNKPNPILDIIILDDASPDVTAAIIVAELKGTRPRRRSVCAQRLEPWRLWQHAQRPRLGAAMGVERSLYDRFGYPPEYLTAEDVMLPFYAYLCKGTRFIPEPLLKYRVHAQNTSMTLQWERSKNPIDKFWVWAEDRASI
jgi:hypothetical protein